MYYRIELDDTSNIEPMPRYLEADTYIDAYIKAKKLFKEKIIAVMTVKDFFYNVVNRTN